MRRRTANGERKGKRTGVAPPPEPFYVRDCHSAYDLVVIAASP